MSRPQQATPPFRAGHYERFFGWDLAVQEIWLHTERFSCNMPRMSIAMVPIKGNRLLYLIIVTVSLHLVVLGMRLPAFPGAHSPKPHSRAVIETTVKGGQEEGARKNLVDAICQHSVGSDVSTLFVLSSRQEIQKYAFIPPGHSKARAPPMLIA